MLLLLTALLMRGNQPKNIKFVFVACLLIFAVYGLKREILTGLVSIPGIPIEEPLKVSARCHGRNFGVPVRSTTMHTII